MRGSKEGGGGGAGGPDPPGKSQKYRGFEKYWSGSPGKSQSYHASIQCRTMIGTLAKRHFNDVPLVSR